MKTIIDLQPQHTSDGPSRFVLKTSNGLVAFGLRALRALGQWALSMLRKLAPSRLRRIAAGIHYL